jgi:hypothetical protein
VFVQPAKQQRQTVFWRHTWQVVVHCQFIKKKKGEKKKVPVGKEKKNTQEK